jgi:hypothetical protein
MTWARLGWLPSLLALLAACEPIHLIENPKVQRWCADRPCGWSVDSGRIERVGSWHSHDYAVAFLDDDTQLSQLNATVTDSLADCFLFTMIAKVERDVRMFLELDFLDDGEVELSQRLPESDWERLSFLITPPPEYDGVRFIVRKDGPGRAMLGQLSAIVSSNCTAVPLELRNRPAGYACEVDEQCRDGRCIVDLCAVCGSDDDCANGELCGIAPGVDSYLNTCVEMASDEFGARCQRDAECQSGICCEGVCSQCCFEDCAGGRRCGYPQDWYESYGPDAQPSPMAAVAVYWPMQCGPGSGAILSGELCTTDADCSSGRCLDSRRGCEIDHCDPEAAACLLPCLDPRVYGGVCE